MMITSVRLAPIVLRNTLKEKYVIQDKFLEAMYIVKGVSVLLLN